MATHRTLMHEEIDELQGKTVIIDSDRYRVNKVKHFRNGVFKLDLKGATKNIHVEVLVDQGRIIYIDF